MNWIVRFGNWLENRRIVRKPDFEILKLMIEKQARFFASDLERMDSLGSRLMISEERLKKIEDSSQIPATIAKELALLKIRLDQMELYVGLKREPKPEHIRGAAKII